MTVVTRFAPSPTGYLHIGGARTALFNYLYAKNRGGKFLLRIEDTDTNRSTKEAVNTILNGLLWLGITHDDEIVYQMQRQERHVDVAKNLLKEGKAYKCYCSKEELEKRREEAQAQGKVYIYEGKCRELKEENAPKDIEPVIRLKIDKEGQTIINDTVMGKIEVKNKQLDDFIILRSNGIPTYLFAVVVDDYDMAITNVIRGDDHLTNTFRQYQVYKACGWDIPTFAHLPLIHSPDGTKMSKRYGAVAVESYKDLGFLPEAIRNYLLRLGWSHGNDEIISDEQAIEWFDIKNVNKSPARFDITKLTSINAHYIKQKSNENIVELIENEYLDNYIEKDKRNIKYREYLIQGLDSIKERSKTILEIIENSLFYITAQEFAFTKELNEILTNNKDLVLEQIKLLELLEDFSKENLNAKFKDFAQEKGLKLGEVVKCMRILLCGKMVSPASVFEIMSILKKEETLKRLNAIKNL